MDKRRSVLNVSFSIVSRIILVFAGMFVRRLLIRNIGNDVNGLNSLYSSIIGMLSVAELGVGSAIVFSMYKPIVEDNRYQVAALYCLYRKWYRIIGAVIFGAGMLVMPFLPLLIGDYDTLSINVYLTFFLTLFSVVLSYLYSAKTSLIEAYKDNYISTAIMTVSRLIRFGLQVVSIIIWRSYVAYLLCHIVDTLLVWILTEAVIRCQYRDIISIHANVDQETQAEIARNVKAMFLHKIGTLMVYSIDNLVISGFIGVVVLGYYSNYTLIVGMVADMIGLFFTPLTAVVGHLCAEGDSEKTIKYFYRFYRLNYALGILFFLGYYAVADNVVALCFGSGIMVSRAIIFIISLNSFTTFMRRTNLLFRDASGTFYYDRWKPVAEGAANLVLSLIFVIIFPKEYRIVGVIVATIITTLFICHIVEPYVIFRHLFHKSPVWFCLKNYAFIGGFIVCLLIMTRLMKTCSNDWMGLLVNGGIAVGVSGGYLGVLSICFWVARVRNS